MYAWYLQSAGRYEEARAQLRALRDRQLRALGSSHPYVADAEDRLARVDLAQGRLEEAAASFKRALDSDDAREDVFGSVKHQAASGLAAVDMERGRFEAAWPVVSANYAAATKTPRENQYRSAVVRAEGQMARVLAGLHRPAEARPHFERAIEALAQGYAGNPELAVMRARYAQCLLALGETAPARQQLQLARAALAAEAQAAPHFRLTVEQAARRVDGAPAVAAR
jgi:tetratricopeptide (TPR) repeat protein